MLFSFICIDKANHGEVRKANRADHLAHLEKQAAAIAFAGPMTTDDGQAMLGSLLVVDFPDRAAAEAFAAADPYARAGLFAEVRIAAVRQVFPKR